MAVTIVVGKHTALGGISVFVLVALVAVALGAPLTAQGLTTYTRSASCAGLDFYPTDSRTEYNNDGALRVLRVDSNPQGTGAFRCDPGLPTGAVVKQVQFTALIDGGQGIGDCALRRSGLTVATSGTVQDLGRVTFGGGPGTVFRLTDSSISNATIDNANWGYWLECQFDLAWPWDLTAASGLYGANVIYTITAAKG